MSKKNILEKGQIYLVPLSDESYTLTQLINHHPLGQTKSGRQQSVDTYAFFDYRFLNKEEAMDDLINIDLTKPFSILTSSGKPKQYDWILLEVKPIQLDEIKYLKELDKGGYFNNYSTTPSILLEPYFGLFPWDGYFKDDYLNIHLLPNAETREDIKYLKDFTTKELKELLPSNSPKLINRLKEEESLK
ncbi:hypothetical protein V2647_14740 [Tenacibaculum maritimum]|uniref:hypothetical protein n=1 Tax=Tenacibaculum maritimum TaxID=107401 RepID=UPI003876E7EE